MWLIFGTFSRFSVCNLDITLALVSYKHCDPAQAGRALKTAAEETNQH